MNDNEEPLTRLLESADPASETPDDEALGRVWARLDAQTSTQVAATPLRPRRWRRLVAVGAAVGAVTVATAAGARYVTTQSGEWQDPQHVSAGGAGELYRLNGTDLAERLTELTADVAFPTDASRSAAITAMVAEASDDGDDAVASTEALRAEAARQAVCSWVATWESGDRTSATGALRGALRWTAVTDVDPTPSLTGDTTDAGNGPTVFGFLPGITAAAAAGDQAALTAAVQESGWCWGPGAPADEVPPAPGDADGAGGATPAAKPGS